MRDLVLQEITEKLKCLELADLRKITRLIDGFLSIKDGISGENRDIK